nr:TOBE domain-containing protein [Gammaproteobacteria bacterium]
PDSLSMTIDLIEPMGAETLAHLKSEGTDQGLRVVSDWKTPLTEGEQVHAQFAPGSTHIFGSDELLVTTI